ncbi:hypothetical protein DFH09DRAFT_1090003 [Mycena vulgaris]|nr:hypothetical protein DFH09DRAFT_1090003 [Mycena vulgaris]
MAVVGYVGYVSAKIATVILEEEEEVYYTDTVPQWEQTHTLLKGVEKLSIQRSSRPVVATTGDPSLGMSTHMTVMMAIVEMFDALYHLENRVIPNGFHTQGRPMSRRNNMHNVYMPIFNLTFYAYIAILPAYQGQGFKIVAVLVVVAFAKCWV